MEKLYPSQIIKMQDLELISILENYANYSESTIIFTYSEFTRRSLRHTVLILRNIEEFEKKYLEFDNYDINTSILKWNQKNNTLSDAELDLSKLEQEIIQTNRYEKSKTRLTEINPRLTISAGKDKNETDSGVVDNLFLSISSYLLFIDHGHLFRKPFSWLYSLMAVLNLILPVYCFYKGMDNHIFDSQTKFIIVFLIVWIIIAFAGWVSFQLWWDRKSKVLKTSLEGDDFVATPVFSNLIQTLGEWIGTWVGIVGFSVALLTTLVLGDDGNNLSRELGFGFMKTGYIFIILMPIYGFLIIVATRFLAEQFRALTSIANNTKKFKNKQ